MLSSYRIQCMWKPGADPATVGANAAARGALKRSGMGYGAKLPGGGVSVTEGAGAKKGNGLGEVGTKVREEGYRVIAGLTLYKVRDLQLLFKVFLFLLGRSLLK